MDSESSRYFRKFYQRKKEPLKHIFYWFIYVLSNHLIRIAELSGFYYKTVYLDSITKYGLGICVFYFTTYYLFPKFSKRYLTLSFFLLALLFLHNTIRFICYSKLFNLYDTKYEYPYTYWGAFPSATWYVYMYSVFGLGFFIFRRLKATTDILILQQKHNHSLQTENLKLEYKFLRAQINPHFLYNVLGFFYNKVNTKDENAGRGIMLLTEMMRYSIREAEADDKVLLKEEIQAINNLLDLQKLRFEGSTHTAMYVAEGMDMLRIVPHVLVTLVENACKHGDLTHEDDPLKISAQLIDGWFVFTTVNRIRTATSVERTDGFGLENLATRLRLQYDDNQYFAYGKEGGYYKVTFKLKAAIMAEEYTGANSKMENSNQTPITEKQNQWLPA